jgi:hypothetical protein
MSIVDATEVCISATEAVICLKCNGDFTFGTNIANSECYTVIYTNQAAYNETVVATVKELSIPGYLPYKEISVNQNS